MLHDSGLVVEYVFCRIGSLEKSLACPQAQSQVFCRIGSLESRDICWSQSVHVFCRIGSLETAFRQKVTRQQRFLPHRQLRNWPAQPE